MAGRRLLGAGLAHPALGSFGFNEDSRAIRFADYRKAVWRRNDMPYVFSWPASQIQTCAITAIEANPNHVSRRSAVSGDQEIGNATDAKRTRVKSWGVESRGNPLRHDHLILLRNPNLSLAVGDEKAREFRWKIIAD